LTLALDTSVAVPLIIATHSAHGEVLRWWKGRDVVLAGHALAETYSVLTRLPADLRLTPADAAELIAARFGTPLLLARKTAMHLPGILAERGVAGGAVYDALVGLAARDNNADLGTRDLRAKATYEAVGARVVVAA
jgi:predicted nucleic acid-binding protein